MTRRRKLTFLVLAVFLTFAIVCYWMLQRGDFYLGQKFAVVKKGVLLRSKFPTIPRLQKMKRRYQIKTIVVLLDDLDIKNPIFGAEQNFAKQHGINFIRLEMGFPTPEHVTKFLEIVNNPTNQPVLVHCWHGSTRTGTLVAIYRIKEQGWPLQKALDEMVSYGFNLESPQYKPMVDIILRFANKTESKVAPTTNH